MKTLISILVMVTISTNSFNNACKASFEKKSGKMTFSVEYNEKEAMSMSGGVPMKKKMKLGDDFNFDFSFSGKHARFQKQKVQEPKEAKSKRISFTGGGFSSSEAEPVLPIDEFETAVFDFDENKRMGLATVLEKDILVEVALSSQNLNFKVTNETKEIIGYAARKAVSEDEKITIWFTDELDIHSPWQLEDLNGVVLSFEDKTRTIIATALSFGSIDASLFELPDRKILEEEQYVDLKKEERDELMKSIQDQLKASGMDISLEGGGIKIKKGGN